MTRRRRTIALLLDRLTSEYAVHLRRAVERAAKQRDVDLLVVTGQRLGAPSVIEATQNGIYELITPERVDGVIVVSATLGHYCGPEAMIALCRSYAPLPVCSVGLALDGIPSLVIDNVSGMESGVAHLIDVHQCRRVAFIAAQVGSVESEDRLAGYRRAHVDRGLAIDDQLIVHGDFHMASGGAAMRALLERGVAFDAVVAANDDMALGALDVLEAHGLHVPRDIMVCGFDDIESAHFARPSLSTLRQPMWWLGAQAVDAILRQLAGETLPACTAGAVEFVRRESCGCGYHVALSLRPTGRPLPSVRDALQARRGELEQLMRGAVLIPNDALGDWSPRIVDALDEELSGKDGHFAAVFEELLERAQSEGASLDEFQRVVSTLRTELRRTPLENEEEARKVERIWHTARVSVGAASIRTQGRHSIDAQQATITLGRCGERLAATLSLPLLKDALAEELPRLQIRRAAVSLYADRFVKELTPFFVLVDGIEPPVPPDAFPEAMLAPAPVLEGDQCQRSIVVPLTFEAETLGVAVFDSGVIPSVYESLRQQIGSAIKGALLHRQVVAQVAARERLEHQRLTEEARLAAQIQTSLGPVLLDVPGLELASIMLPAAEAGGDYYDILPTGWGAWLAIGDVTGHGLAAGLVMVMIQSMIAGMVRAAPDATPSHVVTAVNEAIYDNVRHRLKRDDHVTLTLLRYDSNGRVRFAGAHEDLVIWRARTGRCEVIAPTGFWVGAIPSIRRMTQDAELVLEPDDLLLLYTDGATEPRNAQHEQFGLERLIAAVEAGARRPVVALRDQIVEEVKRWSSSLDDDITLVVARYRPPVS